MADDKPAATEPVAEEAPKPASEEKKAGTRKKSLGVDESLVIEGGRQRKKAEFFQVEVKDKPEFAIKPVCA